MTAAPHGSVDWPELLSHRQVERLVDLAIEEDLGPGDVTSEAIFRAPAQARASLVARSATVVCGLPLASHILARYDASAGFEAHRQEGDACDAGTVLATLEGDVARLLAAERVMLNFLMRLCGVATTTRRAVSQLAPDGRARIYDTRKTLPGWRLLDKAAVRTGGGENHRVGLFDAILIKDNHLVAAGSIAEAVSRARTHAPSGMAVEVEVDTLAQLDQALDAGADIILLDNFDDAMHVEAVRRTAGRALLEASGGIDLERLAVVSRSGVDRISLGMLTHSARPADLALDFVG